MSKGLQQGEGWFSGIWVGKNCIFIRRGDLGEKFHEIISRCFEAFCGGCKCGCHSFQVNFVEFHRETRCRQLYGCFQK